ncbi:MAG: nickel-responsive transcriptional regulator NikR [Eggerthellaceae bacterium]|nr:nickel-responsive transcriptional regulator NikR [Eggerthellaceae bacterium]
MSHDLLRFSIAMPEDLLTRFDTFVAKRGLAKNRSEVIRDLVRDALAQDESTEPGAEVVGTLTIIFDHHGNDLREKLDSVQHDHLEEIITTTHVHLDHSLCMEVIVLRGESAVVQNIAHLIIGTKGVVHGSLSTTATGKNIFGEPLHMPSAVDGEQVFANAHKETGEHNHTHDHDHIHANDYEDGHHHKHSSHHSHHHTHK